MLPLQGQGASQSFEDAEALGTYFRGYTGGSLERTNELLQVRQFRATSIAFSHILIRVHIITESI